MHHHSPRTNGPSLVTFSAAAALAALAAGAHAQTLDDLRDQLRDDLRSVHFAKSFSTLITLSDELELSGAHYTIDNDSDTELTSLSIPYRRTLRPWGEDSHGLYVEAAIGYARASEDTDDIYGGDLPGFETRVEADWTTFGGLAGVGIEFEPKPGLKLTPILNIGLAKLENDSDYSGPGAAITELLADGIAFNWEALVASLGVAGRAQWDHNLSEKHTLTLLGRYDARWSETIQDDDPAQDFSATSQLVTLRADVTGPTGLTVHGGPLTWRATVGYRHFLEGDLFGADNYVQIGGGIELSETPPIGKTLSLTAGYIIGPDIEGYSLGLGLSF